VTPEEYREAILAWEDRINEKLEQDKSKLLCSLQAKNQTYVKNPGLVCYTAAYQQLVDEAQSRMAEEAELIETHFYDALQDGDVCT
jgi:hypothetical protein